MKVYLTYKKDCSISDFSLYHVDTDRESAICHYLEHDLIEFLLSCRDTLDTILMQEVEVTEAGYHKLQAALSDTAITDDPELNSLLSMLYWTGTNSQILVVNSDNNLYDIVDFYCEVNPDLDFESTLDSNKVLDVLFENKEQLTKVIRDWIKEVF